MNVLVVEHKRLANLAKYGADQEGVEAKFDFARALVAPCMGGRAGPTRYKAIGWLDDDIVTLVFSPLSQHSIGLASLRPATAVERKLYEEHQ